MENSSQYQLDPELRAKLLADLPPVKADSEKLSEESAADLICNFPNLTGINAGMPIGEVEGILEREGKAAYNKYTLLVQIDESKQKLQQLKQDVEKEELRLLNLNKQLKNDSLSFAEKRKRGHPTKDVNRTDVTKRLIKKWILALQVELEVTSCVDLAKMMDEDANINNERNWRIWRNGTHIPPPKTFQELMSTRIKKGKYAGKTLSNISLSLKTPDIHDLFSLLYPRIFDEEARAAEAAEAVRNFV